MNVVEYKVMMLGPFKYVVVRMDNGKKNGQRMNIFYTGAIPIMCLSLFLR